jgi:O-antigen/teichoic acid export membrane protein
LEEAWPDTMVNGERVMSGFRTELIAKGVRIITGSGLLIILARELGSNDYGRLSLALSVFSFGVLFANFGFPISGARYITEYLQKDAAKIRFIIRITTVYIVGSTVVVCGLLLILSPVIDQNLVGHELQSLLAVGTLYIAAQSFVSYPRRMFQAFGAIELASLNSVLTGICNFVFILIFIYLGWGRSA